MPDSPISPHPEIVTKASKKFTGLIHPQWGWVVSVLLVFFSTVNITFVRLSCLFVAVVSAIYAFHNTQFVARRWKKTSFAALLFVGIATGMFYFAAYLDKRTAPLPIVKKASRLQITGLVPIPPSQNQEFIVRVLFRSVGDIGATNFVHRVVVQICPTSLTPESEEESIRDAASIKPRLDGTYDELYPSPERELSFSAPNPPSNYMTSQYEDILAGKKRLYVFVALKYRDAALPANEVRVTEFCGWFSGKLDSWGNCGHNRTFVEQFQDTPARVQPPQQPDLLGQVHTASSGYMPIREAPKPIIYILLVASIENRGANATADGFYCVVRTGGGKTTVGKSTNIPEGLTITHGQQPSEILHANESLALKTAKPIPLGKSVTGQVICWMDGVASPEEIRQIDSLFELHFKDSNGRSYVAHGKVTEDSVQVPGSKQPL